MLSFNSNKFEFSSIWNTIQHFYAVGMQNQHTSTDDTYAGLKEREKIIVENIHDNNRFTNRWEHFTKELQTDLGKEIICTTGAQHPCYSSYIVLEKFLANDFTRTKELHFFVSLLGPFYTVVGQDNNAVQVKELTYRSSNYIVVSPEYDFAEPFNFLCNKIQAQFNNYRFVPFDIYNQVIDGLIIADESTAATVFNALFNTHISHTTTNIAGDEYFLYTDWIKEGHTETGAGWTIYSPVQ